MRDFFIQNWLELCEVFDWEYAQPRDTEFWLDFQEEQMWDAEQFLSEQPCLIKEVW